MPAIKKKTVTPDTTESEGEEELSAKRPRVDAEVTEGFRLVVCVCVCKCVCECVCDKAAFFFQGVPDLGVVIEGNPNIFLILVEVLSYVHARMHTHTTTTPHLQYRLFFHALVPRMCKKIPIYSEHIYKFYRTRRKVLWGTGHGGRKLWSREVRWGSCCTTLPRLT